MGRNKTGISREPKLEKARNGINWEIHTYHIGRKRFVLDHNTGIALRDYAAAEIALAKFKDKTARAAVTGADLTFADANARYLADNPDINLIAHNTLWEPTQHITGPLKMADADTPRLLHKLRNELLAGTADRRHGDHWQSTAKVVERLSAVSVNNVMGLHRRLIRHMVKATDIEGNQIFPQALARDKEILNTDKVQNFHPRRATEFAPSIEEFWEIVEHAKVFRMHKETDDGRLSIAYRLLMLLWHGGGQRSARNGAMPWANIHVGVAKPYVSFTGIAGIRDGTKKRAVAHQKIEGDAHGGGDLDVNFHAMLLRAKKERLKMSDGTLNPWYLDSRISVSNVNYIIRSLYKKIGIDFGGPHTIRKAVATYLSDEFGVEYAAAVMGISIQVLVSHYLKGQTRRQGIGIKGLADSKGKIVRIKPRLIKG